MNFKTDYTLLSNCLVCGSDKLKTYCDLGYHPLANNLKEKKEDISGEYQLKVNTCQKCSHKQLSIAIYPELLFSNYLYRTGVSDVHMAYFADFVIRVDREFKKIRDDLRVLDIGSNDGSLLGIFRNLRWDVVGVEPSQNLVDECRSKKLNVVCDFFPPEKIAIEGPFDVITAFNVFAHNKAPGNFLYNMMSLLRPGGRIYIQTTLDRLDSFYHEHISYFNITSMNKLCDLMGAKITSFREVSMHGKSYLFEIHKKDETPSFNKENFKSFLRKGTPFVGYGASAHGIVLLNCYKEKPEYVVDDNDLKQGRYIPGVNVPVVGSNFLYEDKRPLDIVILAYNLFDEIKRKIMNIRRNPGDVFIHPLEGAK